MRTVLLTMTTCLFVLPAQAKYSGGSGTAQDPYRIATAADLIALGETAADYDKHFLLTADVDLDPNLPGRKVFGKAVIAPDTDAVTDFFQGTPFTGVFDGNAHTISHLRIKGGDHLGLFGQLASGADVRDLGVVDVNIAGSGNYVAGLVGWNGGTVTQCYSTGAVSGKSSVGGLLGHNWGNVTQCRSTVVVNSDGGAGGLAGSNGGTVTRCYSAGAVSGGSDVGGLVGQNAPVVPAPVGSLLIFGHGSVTHSYSTATVSGNSTVGGLVGDNTAGHVTDCYSTGMVSGREAVGGLVGDGETAGVTHGVWDTETSGLSKSAGGAGLTTREMMDPYMLGLNGFANDPNWVLDAGRDYPRLAWERTGGQLIPSPKIDWLAGRGTAEEPYRIDKADQLILLGKSSVLWDKRFVLGADIDLDPNLPNSRVFGQAVILVFAGVFDGNSHTISHLTIKGGGYLGLFGELASGADVRDLGVVDVNITGSGNYVAGLVGWNGGTVTQCYSAGAVSGGSDVGGLVGSNSGSVTQCFNTGSVRASGVSGPYGYTLATAGGLVGYNSNGTLTQCYSSGAVSGLESIGGLVGYNSHGTVTQCYSSGAVNGTSRIGGLVGVNWSGDVIQCHSTGVASGTEASVGGLVGYNSYGSVTQCYSTGAVTGKHSVGGLVGSTASGVIKDCYSTANATGQDYVGGLVGYRSAGRIINCYAVGAVVGGQSVAGLLGMGAGGTSGDPVTGCFWDIQTSGRTWSAGGTAKTTTEMQTAQTFLDAGWDFVGESNNGTEDVWWIDEGKDYPRLWWELNDELKPNL